jgi:hypothetical protein
MPGTAAETLLNSSSLNRLFAKANSVPAPPRACGRVMESSLVSFPTNSELELFVDDVAGVWAWT